MLETVLLALYLCILALRVTYTEAPTAQTSMLPGMVADTVYSVTLSALLIFGFVLWLVRRIAGGRLVYHLTGLEPGLALFALAAVLSTLGASDVRTAITHAVMLIAPMLAALLLTQILDSPARRRIVLVVIVALGVVSAYGCAEQFLITNAVTIEQYEKSPEVLLKPLGIEPGTFQHFLFEHRLYSRGIRAFFTTGNSAASFLIMASFAAAALLFSRIREVRGVQSRNAGHILFALLATAIVVAGLLLTQSKGGIMALFAGAILFALLLLLDRRFGARKRRILAIAAPVLLLLAIGASVAVVSYGLRHERLPGGNSMLVRWQYWVASARMYAEHPLLGVGPGNFSFYYPHYKAPAALEAVADPHNFLLSLSTQYGPLGLLGVLIMVLVPLGRSIARVSSAAIPRAEANGPFRRLALGILLAVCVCLLVVRPQLIPMTGADSAEVMFYEAVALYITPVAAFLIGFLLIAAPLGPSTERRDHVLPAALAAAVLAVLMHNLIDFALFEPGVWMTFWTLVACLIATSSRSDEGRRITVAPGRTAKWLAIAGGILLAGVYYWHVWKPIYTTALSIHAARRSVSQGRLQTARDLLERAQDSDPLSPVPPSVRGRVLMQQYEQTRGNRTEVLQEAAEAFRLAVERNPASYKNYEKLGIVSTHLAQFERAYEWYAKATEHYPGSGRLWFELARTAERLDRPEAAREHYRKAVAIEESYRRQFRRMYPDWETVVSRLGEREYRLARERITSLAAPARE